ncbi:hypothetical protein M141_3274 [Bacteroides fragilis str. S38L5]|nr:hypothetical protein M141_3274 [Bacteroides fragilis str. S38L5]
MKAVFTTITGQLHQWSMAYQFGKFLCDFCHISLCFTTVNAQR